MSNDCRWWLKSYKTKSMVNLTTYKVAIADKCQTRTDTQDKKPNGHKYRWNDKHTNRHTNKNK